VQDKQTQVKMIRSGETAFEKGKWYINDEMVRTGIFVLFPISLSFFSPMFSLIIRRRLPDKYEKPRLSSISVIGTIISPLVIRLRGIPPATPR
jgi:hypothetical protein